MDRRKFLILGGGILAGLAVPSVGYSWWKHNQGELPFAGDPFAPGAAPRFEEALPILVLAPKAGGPVYADYLPEILRAEGWNNFALAAIEDVDRSLLAKYGLVILGPGPLEQGLVETLTAYVRSGGRLIAIRPDLSASVLFGLKPLSATLENGRLRIDPHHPAAQGITPTAMRFFSQADLYDAQEADVVAWLTADEAQEFRYPAVTVRRLEQGWAAAWTYDLPACILNTRQGNILAAGQENDGLDGERPTDHFAGWLDLEHLAVPRADEQQRLLSNLFHYLGQATVPPVRFWYFPNKARSVLVATSDSHNNTFKAITEIIQRVEQVAGSVSFYYQPPQVSIPGTMLNQIKWTGENLGLGDLAYPPSPAQIRSIRERGHEFSLHPVVDAGFEEGWQSTWKSFTRLGYGPVSPTIRTHQVRWSGWSDTAYGQAAYGIRMNLDFYHIGKLFKMGDEWPYGHFTGSGLPMKFMDQNGRLLNIYQQLTQLTDEHLIPLPWGKVAGFETGQAVAYSRNLLQSCVDGAYAAVGANFHADLFDMGDPWYSNGAGWLEGTLQAAAERDIPVMSAERWLAFTRSRQDTLLTGFAWDGSRLTFEIRHPEIPAVGLGLLIPLTHAGQGLAGVSVDGRPVDYSSQTVGGIPYALLTLPEGASQVEAGYTE